MRPGGCVIPLAAADSILAWSEIHVERRLHDLSSPVGDTTAIPKAHAPATLRLARRPTVAATTENSSCRWHLVMAIVVGGRERTPNGTGRRQSNASGTIAN